MIMETAGATWTHVRHIHATSMSRGSAILSPSASPQARTGAVTGAKICSVLYAPQTSHGTAKLSPSASQQAATGA